MVNRTKSKCAPLAECEFLGFKISKQGKVKWTEKAMKRCKLRVKEITRRNPGQSAEHVIDELRQFANGWMTYFGISHTYREVLMLDAWMRRRVRLYYWKQWERPRNVNASCGLEALRWSGMWTHGFVCRPNAEVKLEANEPLVDTRRRNRG